MSNKREATWHPNSGPATDNADLIARLDEADRLIYSGKGVGAAAAITLHRDLRAALADSVPREQYDASQRHYDAAVQARHKAERERDEARAERDALAHVVEQAPHAKSCSLVSSQWQGPATRCTCWKYPAPSVSLARHDAEVKAQALDEAADAFGAGAWSEAFLAGDVQDDVSAVRATGTWFKARAAAIRTEAH